MDTAARDDTALVEAVRRGERAGLEGMYRRYADRLYTYARTVLREPEAAADAVHDAFLAAGQRIDQLREPDRLRPWLYAIVRNECLRQLRQRSRSLPLEEAGEPAAETVDPGAGVNAAQVRDLVHSAVAALNPGDREVVHLAIRHDLSSADIGAALGVPANHAHARLSRARSQLERALGALLVARTGARDCPTLAALIDGWQGRLTPTLRKRVSRHIEDCAVCGLLRREQLSPAALLSAYTAPAFLVVADTVWPRLAEAGATGAAVDPTGAVTAGPPPEPSRAGDGPAGPGDPTPPDAPGGGSTAPSDPPVTADGAAVTVDGTAVTGDGTALATDGAAGDGNGTALTTDGPAGDGGGTAMATDAAAVARAGGAGGAVPRGTAHAVRATSTGSRGRHRRRLAAGAAALLLLAALGTWALAPGRPTAAGDGSARPVSEALAAPAADPVAPAPGASATGAGTPAAATPTVGAAGTASGTAVEPADGDRSTATPTPDAVPGGAAPAPTAAPSKPPTAPRPDVSAQVAAPFTVSATAHVRCGSDAYSLVVRATGSATLGAAEVRWTPTGGRTVVRALTVDGSAGRATVGGLRVPALTWSVRATAADGRAASSPTYTVTDPCVRPG
ncbi:sigma-70 family RNA polymerase sigma factor [Micromonospora sp. CPCC 205561]|uniref:sigma-70 family RNA polymerase sigma factor n=1 Tax=Micromonospora sp. CPCC 205561 TaxID=3122407 RepID=UPI002FF1ADE4